MNIEILNYPRTGDETARTIILGGLLVLLSVLVVPTILLVGYLLRVLRSSAADEPDPPVLDEWWELFVDGLRGTVVSVVYGLIPLIGVVIAVGGVITIGADFGALGALGVLIGGLLWIGLTIAVIYALPAALANVAEEGTIGSGFDWKTLRPALRSEAYASAWLIGLLVVLAGGAIASLLSAVPVLGTIGSAFVVFYALVVAYHVVGRAWGDHAEALLSVDPDVGGEQSAV
ncbi:DUF4013 domain-containing protein [Natranaeroarchaeum sulfidigenes]|uniref:Uncharacterized membrane protein, DUF4013 family n=1 Tax=Natranaeroarchaeum sulfidigenes TaxID=2784880 RepID=A0A897MXM8_9EURY|nr:DUF4013 domain-containing protein [Natranaeroarchaeum sulfidigenes]QSG03833.1 Uncharacterized membrane protein, DUF4013 family [Natranaeroarchaeum sulfidigenes]